MESVLKHITESKPAVVSGLEGSSGAYLLSILPRRTEETTVVVVRDLHRAETLARDLAFYSAPGADIETFPSWEILPFDHASPFVTIQCRRMRLLRRLVRGNRLPDIVIVPIEAWMTRLPPRDWIADQVLVPARGQEHSMEETVRFLAARGYQRVPLVEEIGDFSVRGGILDFFPPHADDPVRMEFDADLVESIRYFSPDTQRSTKRIDAVEISPVREIPWSATERETALKRLDKRLPNYAGSELTSLLENISEGILFPGAEFLMPLFHGGLETFLAVSAAIVYAGA